MVARPLAAGKWRRAAQAAERVLQLILARSALLDALRDRLPLRLGLRQLLGDLLLRGRVGRLRERVLLRLLGRLGVAGEEGIGRKGGVRAQAGTGVDDDLSRLDRAVEPLLE